MAEEKSIQEMARELGINLDSNWYPEELSVGQDNEEDQKSLDNRVLDELKEKLIPPADKNTYLFPVIDVPIDQIAMYEALKKVAENGIDNFSKTELRPIIKDNYSKLLKAQKQSFTNRFLQLTKSLELTRLTQIIEKTKCERTEDEKRVISAILQYFYNQMNKAFEKKEFLFTTEVIGHKVHYSSKGKTLLIPLTIEGVFKKNSEKEIYIVSPIDHSRILLKPTETGSFETLPPIGDIDKTNTPPYVLKIYHSTKPDIKLKKPENNDEALGTVLLNSEIITNNQELKEEDFARIDKDTLIGVIEQAIISKKIKDVKPRILYFQDHADDVIVLQELVREPLLKTHFEKKQYINLKEFLTMMKTTLEFYDKLSETHIHRDFKPDNAFINPETNEVYPTDFDTALNYQTTLSELEKKESSLKSFIGTPLFAAPELLYLDELFKKVSEEIRKEPHIDKRREIKKKIGKETFGKIDNYIVGSVFSYLLTGKNIIKKITEINEKYLEAMKNKKKPNAKQTSLEILAALSDYHYSQEEEKGYVKRKVHQTEDGTSKKIYRIKPAKGAELSLDNIITQLLEDSFPKEELRDLSTKLSKVLDIKKVISFTEQYTNYFNSLEQELKKLLSKESMSIDKFKKRVEKYRGELINSFRDLGVLDKEEILSKYTHFMKQDSYHLDQLIKQAKPLYELKLILYAMTMPDINDRLSIEESLERVERIMTKYDDELLESIKIPSPLYKEPKKKINQKNDFNLGESTIKYLFSETDKVKKDQEKR